MLLVSGAVSLLAADPSAVDQRLREALKNTMLQLRTAETERANLQAAQAENELKNKELSAKVEALTKQSTAAEKTAANQAGEITRLKEALAKWETAYNEAVNLAQQTESQRQKSAADVIALRRQVADQQTKNAEMFRLANEILKRYENFGLGRALTAKEPFVGITRVKLENLMQDYGDAIADQKIKPE